MMAEAIAMLEEEGLDNVFARHDRHACARRGPPRRLLLPFALRRPEGGRRP